jgi:N-acetylmuramic acid 6-phosphate etherase
MLATGVDAAAASAALESVGGSVKAAILVSITGVSPDAALARLATHDGVLRDALSEVRAVTVPARTEETDVP